MSSFGRGLQLAGLAARGQAQNRLMGQQIASNQLAVEGAQDALDERYATRDAMGAAANATAGAPVTPQAGTPSIQTQPWTFGGGAAPTPAAAGGTTPMATPAPARGMKGPAQPPADYSQAIAAYQKAIAEEQARINAVPQPTKDRKALAQGVAAPAAAAADLFTLPMRGWMMLGEQAMSGVGRVADAVTGKQTTTPMRTPYTDAGTVPYFDAYRQSELAQPIPAGAQQKIASYEQAITELRKRQGASPSQPQATPGAYAGVGQSMPQQAPAPVGARPAAPQPMGGQPAPMTPPQQPQQPGLGPMSGTLMSAPGVGGGAQLQAFDQQFAQLDAQMRALQPYAGRSSGAAAQFFQLAAQRNTMALQRSKMLFDSAIASGDVGNAMAAFNQMTGANVQVADIGNGQYVLLSNGRPIENQAFDAPTLVSRLRIMSDTALQSEIQKQRFEYYKKLMEIQGNMQVQGMRNEGAANVANIQANTPKVLANNSMEGGFGVYRPAQDQFTFVPGTERGAPVQLPSGETVQTQSQPRTVNLAPPAAAGGMAPIGRDTNVYELLQP